MNRKVWLAGVLCLALSGLANALSPPRVTPKVLVRGLKNPESVALDGDGQVYVSVIGEFNKDGDGAVVKLEKGKAIPFCKGLDDPKGLAFHNKAFYVTDKNKVWKINTRGKASVFAPTRAFPTPPTFLNDLVIDRETGALYVSDSGDRKGKGGAIYRITPRGKVSLVIDQKRWPGLHTPNGLALDGQSFLLVADFGTGILHRLRLVDGKAEKVAEGFGGTDGLFWDKHGSLFITDYKQGRVFGIFRPGDKPKQLPVKFQTAADLCLDATEHQLLIPDMRAGTVTAIAASVPGSEVDTTPLNLTTTKAFPKLKWTNWSPLSSRGKPQPLRPILLTHAGDGSNRIFVPTQRGVVHVFPNDPRATQTKVFLDIEKKVLYLDKQNEQGLLGLAFHPNYKKNGEFFVFYSLRDQKLVNVVSRFRVSKEDPNRADPASEEELFRIKRPFWNHDGGTLCFGPDGYLYIALGDGGSRNDPFNNAQNRKTLLGSILRIDIDHKDPGKNYAIPKDNPFVGSKDARPEIWAYGLRNVWRMAFDRKTGKLWAGEVGQNLYEEIDIITRGGNYGWRLREGLHPFGPRGATSPGKGMIDPIWEYHHSIGLSITGGVVYRGKQFPELQGSYIYGDYVSTRVWALRYSDTKKRVVANRPIRHSRQAILSFGEDEQGEVYLLTTSASGQGIYRISRSR